MKPELDYNLDWAFVNEQQPDKVPLKYDIRCPMMIKKVGAAEHQYNNWHSCYCAERILNNNPCVKGCKQAEKIKAILIEKGLYRVRKGEYDYEADKEIINPNRRTKSTSSPTRKTSK